MGIVLGGILVAPIAPAATELEYCGNGITWWESEECDDGNGIAGDGCYLCKFERYHQVTAAHGFSDDSTLHDCFWRDHDNPGRVTYDGCAGSRQWWDVPLPVGAFNYDKVIKVYVGYHGTNNECYAEVNDKEGILKNWDHQVFSNFFGTYSAGWITFGALAMGSSDTAEVQCLVGSGSKDYISAVKGF